MDLLASVARKCAVSMEAVEPHAPAIDATAGAPADEAVDFGDFVVDRFTANAEREYKHATVSVALRHKWLTEIRVS